MFTSVSSHKALPSNLAEIYYYHYKDTFNPWNSPSARRDSTPLHNAAVPKSRELACSRTAHSEQYAIPWLKEPDLVRRRTQGRLLVIDQKGMKSLMTCLESRITSDVTSRSTVTLTERGGICTSVG